MSRKYIVTISESILKEALGNGARLEDSIIVNGIPVDGELLGAARLGPRLILEFLVDGENGDPVYMVTKTRGRVPVW